MFSVSTLLFIIRIVMTWYPSVPVSRLPWVVAYLPTEPLLKPTRRRAARPGRGRLPDHLGGDDLVHERDSARETGAADPAEQQADDVNAAGVVLALERVSPTTSVRRSQQRAVAGFVRLAPANPPAARRAPDNVIL